MIIAGIVILFLAVLSGLAFVIWKYFTSEKYFSVKDESSKEHKIYISRKGVDLDSGSLGGGTGELFRGSSKESMDTVIMSQEFTTTKMDRGEKHTICLKNMETGRYFQADFTREMILGRMAEEPGGLLLPFSSISRKHCRIFCEGREMYVEDMGSLNGTFVNGKRLTGMAVLRGGDELILGKENFRVEKQ